jgi:hypothetical protein
VDDDRAVEDAEGLLSGEDDSGRFRSVLTPLFRFEGTDGFGGRRKRGEEDDCDGADLLF